MGKTWFKFTDVHIKSDKSNMRLPGIETVLIESDERTDAIALFTSIFGVDPLAKPTWCYMNNCEGQGFGIIELNPVYDAGWFNRLVQEPETVALARTAEGAAQVRAALLAAAIAPAPAAPSGRVLDATNEVSVADVIRFVSSEGNESDSWSNDNDDTVELFTGSYEERVAEAVDHVHNADAARFNDGYYVSGETLRSLAGDYFVYSYGYDYNEVEVFTSESAARRAFNDFIADHEEEEEEEEDYEERMTDQGYSVTRYDADARRFGWKALRYYNGTIRSAHGDQTWQVGQWAEAIDEPDPCNCGYHASDRLIDALAYVDGPVVAWVEMRGTVVDTQGNSGAQKVAAETLRLVEAFLWTPQASLLLLRAFAATLDDFRNSLPFNATRDEVTTLYGTLAQGVSVLRDAAPLSQAAATALASLVDATATPTYRAVIVALRRLIHEKAYIDELLPSDGSGDAPDTYTLSRLLGAASTLVEAGVLTEDALHDLLRQAGAGCALPSLSS